MRALFDRLWNRRDYAALDQRYAEGFAFEGPTDRAFAGTAAYRAFLRSMMVTFPDLALTVDEVYWMGNDGDGYLVATRWSAQAAHGGDALYGPATGRPVQIWGITQHEIRQGRIAREWMLFNELDLMMQIAAARAS